MIPEINVFYSKIDSDLNDFQITAWERAEIAQINRYWSGQLAPPARHATARLLWSDRALFVRFDCTQIEPFVLNHNPQLNNKTLRLWERDVCELFFAPDAQRPEHYFEFEVAPTGEWLDLSVHQFADKRETDWNYCSKMKTSAQRRAEDFTIMFQIPWEDLGGQPDDGSVRRGNLFRCIGDGANRGYLAWQPTLTEHPNFHVPSVFGQFKFVRNQKPD